LRQHLSDPAALAVALNQRDGGRLALAGQNEVVTAATGKAEAQETYCGKETLMGRVSDHGLCYGWATPGRKELRHTVTEVSYGQSVMATITDPP
jgi:hypothetical protein